MGLRKGEDLQVVDGKGAEEKATNDQQDKTTTWVGRSPGKRKMGQK